MTHAAILQWISQLHDFALHSCKVWIQGLWLLWFSGERESMPHTAPYLSPLWWWPTGARCTYSAAITSAFLQFGFKSTHPVQSEEQFKSTVIDHRNYLSHLYHANNQKITEFCLMRQFPIATQIFCHLAFEDNITKQPAVQHNTSEHINSRLEMIWILLCTF